MDRPKMHIWGPDKNQRVIFVDEAWGWFARGWRDHPSKVGMPLAEAMPVDTTSDATKPEPTKTDEGLIAGKNVDEKPLIVKRRGRPRKG